MSEPASAAAPPPIPTLDAEELHRYLVRVHRLETGLHLRFIEGLLAMEEGLFHDLLGYPSIFVYAQKHFGKAPSTTYEALRTAQALKELPKTRQAFFEGFAYSRVAQITQVASAETEEEWLAFAKDTSLRSLRREVQDAKKKQRQRPRKGKYGLSGVHVRLPMDFAPEEFALLENDLKKLGKELSLSLGGKAVEPKAAHVCGAGRAVPCLAPTFKGLRTGPAGPPSIAVPTFTAEGVIEVSA